MEIGLAHHEALRRNLRDDRYVAHFAILEKCDASHGRRYAEAKGLKIYGIDEGHTRH